MATMTADDHPMVPVRERPTRAEIFHDLRKGAGQVADVLALLVTAAASIFAGYSRALRSVCAVQGNTDQQHRAAHRRMGL